MSTTLQTVRIVDLSGISRDMAARIRAGQQEAAKVWMACRDELHRCHRHKPQGRNWVCAQCGFRGHRDLVGSLNMHAIAFDERPMFPAAHAITYLRPGTAFNALPVRSSRPDTGHAKGMLPHGAEDLSQPRVSNARRRASNGSKSSESVGSLLL